MKTVSKAASLMREMVSAVLSSIEFSEIEKITTHTCRASVLPFPQKFQCSQNAQDMVNMHNDISKVKFSVSLQHPSRPD